MKRTPMPSAPERDAMVSAVQAEFKRLDLALAPQLAGFPDTEEGRELRAIQVAQNVMRDCLTAVLMEMMPYSHVTPIEMASRLASYALSAVPLEDQDAVVAEHVRTFADFHMTRTARGTVIASTWKMNDGTEQSNFPEN